MQRALLSRPRGSPAAPAPAASAPLLAGQDERRLAVRGARVHDVVAQEARPAQRAGLGVRGVCAAMRRV